MLESAALDGLIGVYAILFTIVFAEEPALSSRRSLPGDSLALATSAPLGATGVAGATPVAFALAGVRRRSSGTP